MSREKFYGETYWRSLAQRELSHDDAADSWSEFGSGPSKPRGLPVVGNKPAGDDPEESITIDEIAPDAVSRRRFFSVVGASAAFAGVTTTGCIRKDRENILEFSERPEDMIPGKPMFYASAIQHGATIEGVVVESQDGRPTKIEGNAKHSGSQGATSVWSQAAVLEIYDPERTRVPVFTEGGEAKSSDMQSARTALGKLLAGATAQGGQGLGLVMRYPTSPTQRSELRALSERMPKARVFISDDLVPWNAFAAAESIGGAGARAFHVLSKTAIVFAADCDFLHTETDNVRMAREWSKTRRVVGPTDFMSRLYVVEPHLTNTGVMADSRRRVKGSKVGDVMIALARKLAASPDFKLPADASLDGLPNVQLDADLQKFVDALAKDLASPEFKGRSAILVGQRQPAWVHALGLLIDVALGNQAVTMDVGALGNPDPQQPPPGTGSLRWRLDTAVAATEGLPALADAIKEGGIKVLLCLDTNPAYEATGDLGLAKLLEKVNVIHLGLYRDETARLASWHIPVSHFLEAWGDVEAIDGTTSVQQPIIDPLHDTYSTTELLGFIATGKMIDGYSLLKAFWGAEAQGQFSDRIWRQWVHDGIVSGIPREPVLPKQLGWAQALAGAAQHKSIDGLELNVHVDPKVLDGRYAASGWLQELPHPVSKLTWDNAAYMSDATAIKLGTGNQQLVDLTVDGRTIQIPVWIAPGQADDTVSITLGYGRVGSPVCEGAGQSVNPLRSAASSWIGAVKLAPAGGVYVLASTQDYGTLKPPTYMGVEYEERKSIFVEKTRAEFKADPNFVEREYLMERTRLQHLWDPPKLTGKQQWGMSIDLNTCTGCNACVIACQAENNIPTVGKAMVLRAREMHWMRIDRYFRGTPDDPVAVVQPMTCQHCEAAPCETVCPVAATTHSPEGLNDMAYNRCIGTRYCSNNCPYKVRRFNYMSFNLDLRPGSFWTNDADGAWLKQLQKNPDVTVRFRGVMEKCTYCVQRINEAKIEAHVEGRDLVEDGRILTACQQVCPTEAIVFGDIRDPDSKVSKAKRSPRDYTVLRDLNNHPRTTYLARIRNPHPDLSPPPEPPPKSAHGAKPEAGAHGGGGHGT